MRGPALKGRKMKRVLEEVFIDSGIEESVRIELFSCFD